MGGKFNDFSELKSLKMEFDGAAFSKAKSGGMVSPKAEHKGKVSPGVKSDGKVSSGKDMGLRPGCRVTLMDSSDRGVLRRVCDGYAEIEIDGLLLRTGFDEFVVSDPDEEKSLLGSAVRTVAKPADSARPSSPASPNGIAVDLHLEKIPSGRGVPAGAALPFQMEYFRRILHENLRHRGMKITVVHGVGDGILRDAIRREIDERYALRCFWTPGPAGVTVVTIR